MFENTIAAAIGTFISAAFIVSLLVGFILFISADDEIDN